MWLEIYFIRLTFLAVAHGGEERSSRESRRGTSSPQSPTSLFSALPFTSELCLTLLSMFLFLPKFRLFPR